MNAEAYRGAWDAARSRFGDDILFYAPALKFYATEEFQQSCDCLFAPVSVTAGSCELMCDHCRALILGHMDSATTPAELYRFAEGLAGKGGKGLLISGGSDRGGVVPLLDYTAVMGRIKSELDMRVIVHTGITSPELAQALGDARVDTAMIDIIGSDDCIRHVCHIDGAGVSDYRSSLSNLIAAGVPASPHVVIGLDYGRIDGERNAIDLISEFDIASLVLVGLLPQAGTPMEAIEPPSPGQMGEIFIYARGRIPDSPIMLGCERPGGEHKLQTDELALRAGLNGIAYPAEGTIGLAERLGLKPQLSEYCCALAMTGSGRA